MKNHVRTCAVYAEDLKRLAERREQIKRQKIEAPELERDRLQMEAADGRGLEHTAMDENTDVRISQDFKLQLE